MLKQIDEQSQMRIGTNVFGKNTEGRIVKRQSYSLESWVDAQFIQRESRCLRKSEYLTLPFLKYPVVSSRRQKQCIVGNGNTSAQCSWRGKEARDGALKTSVIKFLEYNVENIEIRTAVAKKDSNMYQVTWLLRNQATEGRRKTRHGDVLFEAFIGDNDDEPSRIERQVGKCRAYDLVPCSRIPKGCESKKWGDWIVFVILSAYDDPILFKCKVLLCQYRKSQYEAFGHQLFLSETTQILTSLLFLIPYTAFHQPGLFMLSLNAVAAIRSSLFDPFF